MSEIEVTLKRLLFWKAFDEAMSERPKKVYPHKTKEEEIEYLKMRIEKLRLQAQANLDRKDDLTLRLIKLLSGYTKKN